MVVYPYWMWDLYDLGKLSLQSEIKSLEGKDRVTQLLPCVYGVYFYVCVCLCVCLYLQWDPLSVGPVVLVMYQIPIEVKVSWS